jgi:hypothetical protein
LNNRRSRHQPTHHFLGLKKVIRLAMGIDIYRTAILLPVLKVP